MVEHFFESVYNKIMGDNVMALEIGKKAPAFTAEKDGGGEISLNDFLGKWVVLYFYPKDDTPGCTKEACSFRDNMDTITKLGAEVIGVSPDNSKSHDKFKQKYNLNFHLVSDNDKKICEKYGVLGEKSMFGKKYMGVIRTTYLIDDKGIIRFVFPKVQVGGHTEEVLEKIKELQK
jgi:peroxiredoxin Q/BCP